MRHKVTLLPGEGIGTEVSRATRRILEAAGVQIDWKRSRSGQRRRPSDTGQVLNQTAVESVRRNGVALKARWPPPSPAALQRERRFAQDS